MLSLDLCSPHPLHSMNEGQGSNFGRHFNQQKTAVAPTMVFLFQFFFCPYPMCPGHLWKAGGALWCGAGSNSRIRSSTRVLSSSSMWKPRTKCFSVSALWRWTPPASHICPAFSLSTVHREDIF